MKFASTRHLFQILSLIFVHQGAASVPFEQGANSLFIGHSFFIPVAQAFDEMGKRGEFPDHRASMVFAPGPKGSPGALWDDRAKREKIEAVLATGEVDLFGMTLGRSRNPGRDYGRWIELARKHNPETEILIGFPWLPGGPAKDSEDFRSEIVATEKKFLQLLEGLRENFPDTTIHFINYGYVAPMMKSAFEAGDLTGIEELARGGVRSNRGGLFGRIFGQNEAPASPDVDAEESENFYGQLNDEASRYLFNDGELGHAGPMMLHVCALVWANLLYTEEVIPLIDASFNAEEIRQVVSAVKQLNEVHRY